MPIRGWDRDMRARHRGVTLMGVGTACSTKMTASEEADKRQDRGGDACLIRTVTMLNVSEEDQIEDVVPVSFRRILSNSP